MVPSVTSNKPRASAATATGHTDVTDMSQYMQTRSGKFVATGHADDVDVPQQSEKANKSFRMTTFSHVITVLVKNKKWQVQIPEKLHGSKRVYIQFFKRYGTSQDFGTFILKSLQDVGNLCTNVKQARIWCANDAVRMRWRDHVQEEWSRSREQKPEENIDLEQIVTDTLAYNGYNDVDDSIVRIPDYADKPKILKTQKHDAIRVS